MTIIGYGTNYHIESHLIQIPFGVGAGGFQSAAVIPLDKDGGLLAQAISGTNLTSEDTGTQSIGFVRTSFNGGADVFVFGLRVFDVFLRGFKLASADATTLTYNVVLWISD